MSFHPFDASFDGEGVLLVSSVEGTLLSSQFDGLADGSKRRSDLFSRDLFSSAESSTPDPCSKGRDDDVAFNGVNMLEEGVHAKEFCEGCPFCPVACAGFGSRSHDAKVNGFPRRQDIILDVSLLGRWNSCHEFGCWRGKVVLKKEVRDVKDGDCAGLDGTCRDASSAMELSDPAIGRHWRGEDLTACMRSPRARSRKLATSDFDWAILNDQLTVDALSQ